MGDDVDRRVVHGPHHPLCLLPTIEPEVGMHRGHPDGEPRQDVIGIVERAVAPDVELGPVEDRQCGERGAEPLDCFALLLEPFDGEPTEAKPDGMIRDRQVPISRGRRPGNEVLQRLMAIG